MMKVLWCKLLLFRFRFVYFGALILVIFLLRSQKQYFTPPYKEELADEVIPVIWEDMFTLVNNAK